MIRALAVPRTPGASIEYSILSDNEETTEFAIDKDTGIVTVARNRTLDREKQETHDVCYTCESYQVFCCSVFVLIYMYFIIHEIFLDLIDEIFKKVFSADFQLILLATDTLNRTLQSTRLLSIKLQDINDEEPSFNNCPNRQVSVL